jgi:membrane fusion protein (multidrug efflux system)
VSSPASNGNGSNGVDPRPPSRWRRPLVLGGIVVVAAGVAYAWLSGGRYVSTDNAYVRAGQTTISADVAGRVVAIEVRENQVVRKGDVLFRIDPEPFAIEVEQARARLSAATLEVEALKASYRARQSELAQARETLGFQTGQYQRQKGLLGAGISSQSQVEQVQHARDTARSQISASEQDAAAVLARLGGDPDIPPGKHPDVLQAKAALDRAELDLRRTTVHAPDDGIVAMVDRLQVGDYLQRATPAFALISKRNVWIEANLKEVQLTHVQPGQPATVAIDIYPKREWKAHVVGVAPGTGAQFSVLPAENATGNWVKVVQRLPVRLVFDDPASLPVVRTGLSATVTVDTGDRGGTQVVTTKAP